MSFDNLLLPRSMFWHTGCKQKIPSFPLIGVEGKKVRLCVENPPAEVDLLAVSKEQVEILERLPEEEGLHHVLGSGVERAPHVADGGVAAAHLRVLLDSLRKRRE